MLSGEVVNTKGLFADIFAGLQVKFGAEEIRLDRPIRAVITVNNPEHRVENQRMRYDRFLYIRLAKKIWILCLGANETSDGVHYIADLSALRIFDTKLQAIETIAEIKARLRSSRTFHYSLLCARASNDLLFPLESMHYEMMQAFSDVDPNVFWVAPRHRDLSFGDGQFREPHLQAGFYEEKALTHFVNLTANVLVNPD